MLLLACVLSARGVQAEELGVVVVVPTETADADTKVHHLRSELRALGYRVEVVYQPRPASDDELERLALRAGATASITYEGTGGGVRVWMRDREASRSLVRALPPEPAGEDASARAAIHTTELMIAGLIELGYPRRAAETGTVPPEPAAPPAPTAEVAAPPSPPAAPAPSPPAPAATISSPRPPRRAPLPAAPADRPPPREAARRGPVELRGGGTALLSPGGVPPSVAPSVGVTLRVPKPLVVDLAGWGPAQSRVVRDAGTAQTDQEAAYLRVGAAYPFGETSYAFTALGGGVYRLGVRGVAADENRGVRGAFVSPLVGGGLGATTTLGGTFVLRGEVGALVTTKRPELVFLETTVAHAGQPVLVAELAIGWAP